MKTHILNRVLPMRLRSWLREAAKRAIPSMRHLDMPMRMEHLRDLGFTPDVIYDIGCASGEWTRLAAGLWPQARIYGFEPNKSEQHNLEQVGREVPNFRLFQAFLGSKPGEVSYLDRGHQTSLLSGAEPAARHSGGAAQAPVVVLDDLIAANTLPPPDLLKLDVQGFELEVLKGGEKALQHAQAALLELNFYEFEPGCPLADDVIAFMKSRGMRVYDVMGILRRDSDDALGHMDMMFLRTDHPLMGHPST